MAQIWSIAICGLPTAQHTEADGFYKTANSSVAIACPRITRRRAVKPFEIWTSFDPRHPSSCILGFSKAPSGTFLVMRGGDV